MTSDLSKIELAFSMLRSDPEPKLESIAKSLDLSFTTFSKTFKKMVGVSARKYLQALRLVHTKDLSASGFSTMETSLAVHQSRLHDIGIEHKAVTPDAYKAKGRGVLIHYTFINFIYGKAIVAKTDMGLCALTFLGPMSEEAALEDLKQRWPLAEFAHHEKHFDFYPEAIKEHLRGEKSCRLPLDLLGTNFQIQVWRALLQIPEGCLSSYGQLAEMMGDKNKARAVGGAVGRNPLSILIPCHRIIRTDGGIGGYRWGLDLKRSILASERGRNKP